MKPIFETRWFKLRRCIVATIMKNVLHTPEYCAAPRWLQGLFFPVLSLVNGNPHFMYDYVSDTMRICGNKFSVDTFAWFADNANTGKQFELVKVEDGTITIKEVHK